MHGNTERVLEEELMLKKAAMNAIVAKKSSRDMNDFPNFPN